MKGEEEKRPEIICFGEMVWDCHGDKKIAGGAPFNVGLHLQKLGTTSKLFSSIGQDELGQVFLHQWKEYPEFISSIQIHPSLPTGLVLVENSHEETARYQILEPAAWDAIDFSQEWIPLLQNCKAMLFGSLASRNAKSFETLLKCLDYCKFGIFDINLRPPFVDNFKIAKLLEHTHLLKINEEELKSLWAYFCPNKPLAESPEVNLRNWMTFSENRFPTQIFCLTLGKKGAMIGKENKISRHFGYAVKAKDTVGAGDAFLGGVLHQWIQRKKIEECLDFGCALGALVASREGASPDYRKEEIYKIISSGESPTH